MQVRTVLAMGCRSAEDHDGLPCVLAAAPRQPRSEILGGGRGLSLIVDWEGGSGDAKRNSGSSLERDAVGYLGDIQTMRFQTRWTRTREFSTLATN